MIVSLIYTYYNNPEMLRRQLREWASYIPECKAKLDVIIIDDGSEQSPALPVVLEFGDIGFHRLSLYRVKQNIPWNQDGARNLAMKNIQTEWSFMCDIDHLIPFNEIGNMWAHVPFKPRRAYMPNQLTTDGKSLRRPHPNSFLMRVDDFWEMGGYDEDLCGYYGSDGNFKRLMAANGIEMVYIDGWNVVAYSTKDIWDSNTKGFGRKKTNMAVHSHPHLLKKVRGPAYKPVDPIRFKWERQI